MTYLAKPKLHHPTLPKNKAGFTRRDYEGKVSTLCAGCGHDSISAALIQAFWELDILPHRVAKLYLPSGAKYFGSREGYGLTHRSCQESGKSRRLYRLLASEMGTDEKTISRLLKEARSAMSGVERAPAPLSVELERCAHPSSSHPMRRARAVKNPAGRPAGAARRHSRGTMCCSVRK